MAGGRILTQEVRGTGVILWTVAPTKMSSEIAALLGAKLQFNWTDFLCFLAED